MTFRWSSRRSLRSAKAWSSFPRARWAVNESGENRYILGGSWEDASYMFSTDFESRRPFERLSTHGFRCAKYPSPLPNRAAAPIDTVLRDYRGEEPVGDDVFTFFRGLYAYDRTPLDAASESMPSDRPYRAEKITFAAASGDERVTAYLYLPFEKEGPYQTVVMFPASDALHVDSLHSLLQYTNYVDFIVRSGRAC